MEKEKFEDKLKDAFDQAEVSPSDNVWTNIELDLSRADGILMRQRLNFFKMLAAASVIFALGVGGASIYLLNNGKVSEGLTGIASSRLVPEQKPTAPETKNESGEISNNKENSIPSNSTAGDNKSLSKPVNESNVVQVADIKRDNPQSTVSGRINTGYQPTSNSIALIGEEGLKPLRNTRDFTLQFPAQPSIETVADPVVMMMARLEEREKQLAKDNSAKEKKSDKNENLWTSVGFAAGAFNATASGNNATPVTVGAAATNNAIADQEAKASGMSYSMGLNMGTKVSERWVVQGGVNYLAQSSDYTAQTAISTMDFTSFRPASISELEKINHADGPATARVVTTAPYNVNNSVRYLSVPLQAGYLLLDKQLGLQLNAGVATDLFLRNNKTAEGGSIDEIDEGRGDNSPYRTVNFSGLVGTEVSYRFSRHYRLALNPGLRYPINSVYKSDLGIRSTPLTFDIGLRFRYIFH